MNGMRVPSVYLTFSRLGSNNTEFLLFSSYGIPSKQPLQAQLPLPPFPLVDYPLCLPVLPYCTLLFARLIVLTARVILFSVAMAVGTHWPRGSACILNTKGQGRGVPQFQLAKLQFPQIYEEQ